MIHVSQISHSPSVGSVTLASSANTRWLDVRANVIVGKQLTDLGQIPWPVRVTDVDEHLPDLRAAEQMLLRGLEEGQERLLTADEESRDTVVEEALVTESVTVSIEGENTFGGHSSQVFRRTAVQSLSGDGQFPSSRHLFTKNPYHIHPPIRQILGQNGTLLIPIPVEELLFGYEPGWPDPSKPPLRNRTGSAATAGAPADGGQARWDRGCCPPESP